ncbi:MAG: methyltransferase [Phaeovulum sp.]|jgi:tRNA1(Val) A37 N6-methylase TrmN6|uniref:tRNA1(Val) (adenine(37)-N6)-methyltransferase n=1 Tax=Phaeovulum sp. TaxID=2934796 RepID=UPI002730726B|nr:methyltransferase [Phaeovulum sp.]MDP2063132.1 methyltransferase [Phaeovulum sp.]
MFADDSLSEDAFLGGRLRLLQPREGFRAAMDAVLLAAACPAVAGQSVLELGCGAGVASLCLGARVPGLRLQGIEMQADYADLARRNAERSAQIFEVFEGDLAAPPSALRARSFDHVLANPPFFAHPGSAAADPGRETAQREATPLAVWLETGLRRLVSGGYLTLILRADRLPDALAAFAPGAFGVTVLPIAARVARPAGRVLVLARKGGRGAFRLLAPFHMHAAPRHLRDGEDLTDAARAILRDGAALAWR